MPPAASPVPLIAKQAPLATIRDIVDGKVPLGRRIRVSGRCIAAGAGRMAGFWTLADSISHIEVRGLVPRRCPGRLAESLTIFAQVEWEKPGEPERLLLRLPG